MVVPKGHSSLSERAAADSASRAASWPPRLSCAACSPVSPTMRTRGSAPGPSPAGSRCLSREGAGLGEPGPATVHAAACQITPLHPRRPARKPGSSTPRHAAGKVMVVSAPEGPLAQPSRPPPGPGCGCELPGDRQHHSASHRIGRPAAASITQLLQFDRKNTTLSMH